METLKNVLASSSQLAFVYNYFVTYTPYFFILGLADTVYNIVSSVFTGEGFGFRLLKRRRYD